MTIIGLYDKVYSTEEAKNPDSYIRMFEENSKLIENQDILIDDESYNAVMRLTADYAHDLKIKESYAKALPYLDRAIELFENFNGFHKEKINNVEFYKILRFDRGVAHYELKNFNKSQVDFMWLKSNNPDHDVFKNWIYALRLRKYNILINILWLIAVGSAIIGTLVDRKMNSLIHDLILYSGTIAFITALIFETLKYITKRRLNAA